MTPLDPQTLKSLGVKLDHLAHAGPRSWQEWHCIHHCFEQRGSSLLLRNSITEGRWIIKNLFWTGQLNTREIRNLSICLVCCQKQLIGELTFILENLFSFQEQNTGRSCSSFNFEVYLLFCVNNFHFFKLYCAQLCFITELPLLPVLSSSRSPLSYLQHMYSFSQRTRGN